MSDQTLWHRARASRFIRGILCGFLIVIIARVVINRTLLADWLVAPLLLRDTDGTAEAIVVPGAGVIGDCVPNQNAVRRVLLAARLWREQRAPLIVFTGGSGEGSCPVATAMARFAREVGVPPSSVRIETASRTTRQNAEFSAPLLRAWGIHRVVIVTDRLHMQRAAGAFTHLGLDVGFAAVPIYEGHNDNVSMLRAGVREYAALAYYRLRGWIGSPIGSPVPARMPLEHVTHRTFKNAAGPVVVLGASYAQGWPLSRVAGIPVVNRGIAGQQSFELLQRFESDVAPAAPRAVILWGFINDIFRAPQDGMEPTLARIRDNYTEMIKLARARGIEPVLATEVTARPRRDSVLDTVAGFVGALTGKPSYQDEINRHVLTINQWLTELGAREGLLVLQFQAVLSEEGGRRRKQFAQPDGSHITTSGYDALSSYATPVLEEFFSAR